jgi:hypothetical protein
MCPFSVTLQHVPDRELGTLLIELARAGFHNPIVKPVAGDRPARKAAASARRRMADPPRGLEPRARAGGRVVSVAGRARALLQLPRLHWYDARRRRGSHRAWRDASKKQVGRDRKYVVAFRSSGSPQQPLAEFAAADDYEEKRELVAVIRGSDGGRRMYGAGDPLPDIRASGTRSW